MPTCTPHAREDEATFCKRAHGELASDIPNADARNAAVFEAWRDAHGESDEEKAAHAKFSDDDFAHIENVPVFKEHEYPRMLRERDGRLKVDEDGQPIQQIEKYDFDALKSICHNLNYRIADTGDFSPISDKHSPKKGTEESKPRIFGFAGPFGLGQVGNKEPKWAIIAKQEHWFKDKAHLAREFSRRSPEVYLGRPMEDRILDPITALGADTPALDMGIHYSQDVASGEMVACYSGPPLAAHYEGACFAGAANTFVPSETPIKKKYAEEPPAVPATPVHKPDVAKTPDEGKTSMISPEDANTIIQALMETEVMKWATQEMMASKAPKQDQPDDKANEPPVDPAAEPLAASPDSVQPPPQKEQLSEEEAPDLKSDNHQEHIKSNGDDDGADKPNEKDPKMASEKKDIKVGYAERDEAREQTAKYAALEQEVALLKAKNAEAEKQAAITSRVAKIQSYRHQGYDLDVDAEIERCSLENMPTEREFQNALDLMCKYSGRIPLNRTLYTPDAPIVEDRHKAENRRNERGEPAFAQTEEFSDEVVAYAEAEQAKPDWEWDAGFSTRCRKACIEKRVQKNGAVKVV